MKIIYKTKICFNHISSTCNQPNIILINVHSARDANENNKSLSVRVCVLTFLHLLENAIDAVREDFYGLFGKGRKHLAHVTRHRALKDFIQQLTGIVFPQEFQSVNRRLAEHAKVVEQQAVVRFVLFQQPVAVQKPRLVVQEHEQLRADLLRQVVRRCSHDVGIPLEIVQIIYNAIEIRDEIVENDEVGPLRELHKPRQHPIAQNDFSFLPQLFRILIAIGIMFWLQSINQNLSWLRGTVVHRDIANVVAIQMPFERPEWLGYARRFQLGNPLGEYDGA